MQASELRIGNWVEANMPPMIVKEIDEYEVRLEYQPAQADYWAASIEWVKGIPLTTGILIKSGAINKYGQNFFIGKLKFDISTTNVIRFHYSGKVTYIFFVHQLQNLYFALTGEELKIIL